MQIKNKFLLLTIICIWVLVAIPYRVIAQEEPQYGGTMTILKDCDIQDFSLHNSFGWYSGREVGNLYDSLIYHDFDINPRPELAKSWYISPDGLTYTFNLVDNATWTDGVPITSADVKFTIENITRPYHPLGKTTYGCVKSIETPGPYTVILKLQYPFAPLLSYIGNIAGMVAPKHVYEGTDVRENPNNIKPLVTSGAFKFVEWVRGDHITLEKNERYWRKGRPYLDRVIYRYVPDDTVRVMMLEKGEGDAIYFWGMPTSEVVRLQKNPPKGLVASYVPGMYAPVMQMWFNLRIPPLNDKKVREAFAHAIDREYIVKYGFEGLGKVAITHLHPDHKWCKPEAWKYEYDVEKANRLLDEAGYPRGTGGIRFEIEACFDPKWQPAAEIAREQLKKVGIDLKLFIADGATVAAKVGKWDFQLNFFGGGTMPDPNVSVRRWFDSRSIIHVHNANVMGYNNTRVDMLFDLDAATTDPGKRKEYWYELQEIILEDLPSIPIWFYGYPVAYWEKFQNFPPDITFFGSLADVWIKPEAVAPPAPAISPTYLTVLVIVIAIPVIYAIYKVIRRAKMKS